MRDPLFAIILVVFVWVFLSNSWVGDDAFITFRVSDNLIHGYGPRWNVAERVQAYTNPLWMFAMAGFGFLTGEFFYTSLALSLACCVGVLVLLRRRLPSPFGFGLAAVLLLSSKAFVDYTSSGLEYPLSYLLIAAFVVIALAHDEERKLPTAVHVGALTFVAALAFVNRADTLILFAPLLASCFLSAVWARRGDVLRVQVLAALPAVLWLAFAIVYYGFPFPNTYYAKVATGMPTGIRVHQGLAYLTNNVRYDPVTLGTLAAAVLMVGRRWRPRAQVLLGASLYACYAVWVGGGFMGGRLFSLPFLSATIVIAWVLRPTPAVYSAAAGLVLLNILNPLAPVKTGPNYEMGWPWRTQNGIKDERGGFHKGTNLLFTAPFRPAADHYWRREGLSLAASPEDVVVAPSIGWLGFEGGPGTYIIDSNGLSEPFLARLPVGWNMYFEFWASHYYRPIPRGYVESRKSGKNELTDPLLRPFYDKIVNVTAGPLFSASRWRDIVDLNLGEGRRFHERFRAAFLIDVGVRAGNPRFLSDVGEVDDDQFVHTTGRQGLLLMGPRLPLPAGAFEVTWTGEEVGAAAGSDLGFVQACHHACRRELARRYLVAGDRGQVMAGPVAFGTTEPVSDIEFRMFVRAGVNMTLHHVSLKQQR